MTSAGGASAFCSGCGRSADECAGCRTLDPPHYCATCGRWMAVAVTPTGWVARCADHGERRSA